MERLIAAMTTRDRAWIKNQYRRVMGEKLMTALMNPPEPANRAERRAKAKHIRRKAVARRAEVRDAVEKCVYRAWRKARRLARAA